MTKLKTRLLKDLPVKTTPITDDDYVVNTNNGTAKLKVKDITKNLETNVNKLNSDVKEILEKGTTAETIKNATEKEIQKQIASGNLATMTIPNGSIGKEKLDPSIKFEIEDNSITYNQLNRNAIQKNNTMIEKKGNLINLSEIVDCVQIHYLNGTELKEARYSCDFATGYIFLQRGIEYKSNIKLNDMCRKYNLTEKKYLGDSGISYNAKKDVYTVDSDAYYRFTGTKTVLQVGIKDIYIYEATEFDLIVNGEYEYKTIDWLKVNEENLSFIKNNKIKLENIQGYVPECANLIILDNVIQESFINTNDGTVSKMGGCAATDFIKVEKYTQYTISDSTITHWCAFYDENKKFLYGLSNQNKTPCTFTTGNVSYARFTLNTGSIPLKNCYFVKGGVPNGFSEYKTFDWIEEIIKNNLENLNITTGSKATSKWENKSVNFLGDSITFQGHYIDELKKLIKFSDCRNYGISGTRLAAESETDTGCFVERYKGMASAADLICVFGGINDYWHGTAKLGNKDDKVKTTLYGALNLLCEGLLKKYPEASICFFTPLQNSSIENPTGVQLPIIVNTIKEVCAKYCIPVFDLYNVYGWTTEVNDRFRTYASDGVHITEKGGKWIAERLYRFLENI